MIAIIDDLLWICGLVGCGDCWCLDWLLCVLIVLGSSLYAPVWCL